jgi:hypothetical protein
MRILPRQENTISSAWLVRVLASSRKVERCSACDARMFVSSHDGLCPVCRNTQAQRDGQITRVVEEQLESVADWS